MTTQIIEKTPHIGITSVHICVPVCTDVHMCASVCACWYICMRHSACAQCFIGVFVRVCAHGVSACTYRIPVHKCACICICMPVHICIFVQVRNSTFGCTHMFACARRYMRTCLCVCVYVYVCLCASVCVCLPYAFSSSTIHTMTFASNFFTVDDILLLIGTRISINYKLIQVCGLSYPPATETFISVFVQFIGHVRCILHGIRCAIQQTNRQSIFNESVAILCILQVQMT